MPVTPDEFRAALGAYATGVTVVTAIGPNGPSGATANAVTSLSLDPPMMLACLDRGSRTLTSVRAQGRFGVNALAAGQEELARRFAGKNAEPDKWEGVEWSESEDLPRLARRSDVGGVRAAGPDRRRRPSDPHRQRARGRLAEGQPLLFHRGAYRDLLAESWPPGRTRERTFDGTTLGGRTSTDRASTRATTPGRRTPAVWPLTAPTQQGATGRTQDRAGEPGRGGRDREFQHRRSRPREAEADEARSQKLRDGDFLSFS